MEKILVTNTFSFNHNVFNKSLPQGFKYMEFCCKGLERKRKKNTVNGYSL